MFCSLVLSHMRCVLLGLNVHIVQLVSYANYGPKELCHIYESQYTATIIPDTMRTDLVTNRAETR